MSEVFLELELNHQKLIEGCCFFKTAQTKKIMEKLASASGPRVDEAEELPPSASGPIGVLSSLSCEAVVVVAKQISVRVQDCGAHPVINC